MTFKHADCDFLDYTPAYMPKLTRCRLDPLKLFPEATRLAEQAVTDKRIASYIDGYTRLLPTNGAELFTRAAYALSTVRTETVRLDKSFRRFLAYEWSDHATLQAAIQSSKMGLIKARTTGIWGLLEAHVRGVKLLGHPERDMGIVADTQLECWRAARERLTIVPYISRKVASMCLHLWSPFECPLFVLDGIMMTRCGYTNVNPNKLETYQLAEDHWLALCKKNGWKYPGIAREVFWDVVGHKRNEVNNYWWASLLLQPIASSLVAKLADIPYTAALPA